MKATFHLNTFKDAYRGLGKHLPKPLKFLLYGYLKWLEEKYIDAKAKAAVESALSDYQPPPSEDLSEGVYVDDLHIQSRWKSRVK